MRCVVAPGCSRDECPRVLVSGLGERQVIIRYIIELPVAKGGVGASPPAAPPGRRLRFNVPRSGLHAAAEQ